MNYYSINLSKLKLRGCPVCGWRNLKITKSVNGYFIQCSHCGYTGKTCRTILGLKWDWNRSGKKIAKEKKKKRKYHLRGREW